MRQERYQKLPRGNSQDEKYSVWSENFSGWDYQQIRFTALVKISEPVDAVEATQTEMQKEKTNK